MQTQESIYTEGGRQGGREEGREAGRKGGKVVVSDG